MVQLKDLRGDVSLYKAESAPIPAEEDRAVALKSACRACLSGGEFKGRFAALCLEGEDVFIQHQRLNIEGSADPEKKIRDEFSKNIPFDSQRAEVRFLVTGRVSERSEIRDELILMIADREVLDRYITVMNHIGLKISVIGSEPLGLMRSYLAYPLPGLPPGGVTCFMNITSSRTELIIIRDGVLVFTRPLPIGMTSFTSAVADKLEIDVKSAARLTRAINAGEPLNDTLGSAALSAMRPVMEKIFSEITSSFRYFASIFNRESVDRMVLAGETAGSIIDHNDMSSRIGVPVHKWEAKGLFARGEAGTGSSILDPAFIPCIGLATEALRDADSAVVDFMPTDVVEKRKSKRSRGMRVASIAALVLVMALIHIVTQQRAEKLRQISRMVYSRCSQIDMKNMSVQELKGEEKSLEEKLVQLNRIRPLARTSRIVAEVAKAAGDGITMREFMLYRTQDSTGRDQPVNERIDGGIRRPSFVIHVAGLARTSMDLSGFVEKLTRSKAFSSIRDEGYEDEMMREAAFKAFSLTLTVGGSRDGAVF